jgi:hypothetical protein
VRATPAVPRAALLSGTFCGQSRCWRARSIGMGIGGPDPCAIAPGSLWVAAGSIAVTHEVQRHDVHSERTLPVLMVRQHVAGGCSAQLCAALSVCCQRAWIRRIAMCSLQPPADWGFSQLALAPLPEVDGWQGPNICRAAGRTRGAQGLIASDQDSSCELREASPGARQAAAGAPHHQRAAFSVFITSAVVHSLSLLKHVTRARARLVGLV